ncbi:PH (Pleckstrin Homology) domain-containing protein [Actinokineospora cianjurensis]|uniref:PH (Pleckstrin Homology) domain-containing protein n=1 Tax=Actinokineospora cianjurensis TaxID=585224 RepID=A0A421B005_9PSEU|nr:PH (Pleckstrin Homology) domain-containing protein [Actinokineospora cianjurensis]
MPSRLVFRVPGIAVLAALLFAICATPFAFAAPGLVAVYVIPIALVVWVLRVRTTADSNGLVVREVVSTHALAWTLLKGLRIDAKGRVAAVRYDETEIGLPHVRARHLPALALISGGRLDDPSVGLGDGGPADEPEGQVVDEVVPDATADSTTASATTNPGADPGAEKVTEDTGRRAAEPE